MTPQIDINELHREFWERRKIRITALLKKPHLVAIIARREADKARFVKLATSDAARIERIRNLRSFECELESAAEEIASVPLVEAQRTRSRRPRGKVNEHGKTLNEVIEALVRHPENLFLFAPELTRNLPSCPLAVTQQIF